MNRRNFLEMWIKGCAALCTFGCATPVAASSGNWMVAVEPDFFETGTIGLVKFRPPRSACKIKVRFEGRDLPVIKDVASSKMPFGCLVPVPLGMKPGRKIINFSALVREENQLYSHPVVVKGKKYPKEFLKVKKKYAEFPPRVLKRIRSDQAAVAGACKKISPETYWQGAFVRPVPGRITSPFGLRRYFNGQPRSPHSGADFAAPVGTPVSASNFGVVVLTRDCYLSGKTLIIDHGGGLFTLYCHLSRFKVQKGEQVAKRQVVALSGRSGRITGPHLHWGVSLLGKRLDPQSLLKISQYLA